MAPSPPPASGTCRGPAEATHDFPLVEGAAAVGGGQRGRALLQVPRPVAILGRAAHGDAVDAVGVAVAGAVVAFPPAVPRCPDEDGAQAVPALEGHGTGVSPAAGTSRPAGGPSNGATKGAFRPCACTGDAGLSPDRARLAAESCQARRGTLLGTRPRGLPGAATAGPVQSWA